MIALSAPILLPMSLAMISTSMLNSIGFEKQSFLFYFIGAAAMLLCVLTLPSICGVYAYLLGFGLSFLLCAVCNLVFLYKKCPAFKKQGGQVCVQRILTPLIFILPISLFGKLLNVVFSRFTGPFLALALSAVLMSALTFLFYLLCGFLSLSSLKARFSLKKRKSKRI